METERRAQQLRILIAFPELRGSIPKIYMAPDKYRYITYIYKSSSRKSDALLHPPVYQLCTYNTDQCANKALICIK